MCLLECSALEAAVSEELRVQKKGLGLPKATCHRYTCILATAGGDNRREKRMEMVPVGTGTDNILALSLDGVSVSSVSLFMESIEANGFRVLVCCLINLCSHSANRLSLSKTVLFRRLPGETVPAFGKSCSQPLQDTKGNDAGHRQTQQLQ